MLGTSSTAAYSVCNNKQGNKTFTAYYKFMKQNAIPKTNLARRNQALNPFSNLFRNLNLIKLFFVPSLGTVWPDLAIYCTLGNFLKRLATINLPKSPTFLGNFWKGVKIYHFSTEIIFGQLL